MILFLVGDGIGNQVQAAPAVAYAIRRYGDVRVHNPTACNLEATRLLWGNIVDESLDLKKYSGQILSLRVMKPIPNINTFNEPQDRSTYNEVLWNLNTVGKEYLLDDIESCRRFLDCVKPKASPDVILHNGYSKAVPGHWDVKGYPFYPSLAEKLKRQGFSVGSVGSSDEYIEGTANFTGCSLFDTACLLRGCRVLVANDTGTYHLAAMMDIPCAVIFTCTSPEKNYHRIFHKSAKIIRKDIDCSPCQRHPRLAMGRTPWITNKDKCCWKCREISDLTVLEIVKSIMERKV